MYARTTTMQAPAEAVDDLVAYLRDDVMPMVTQMEGCVGLSALIDRDSGRCVATSAWDSEEAMRASAERVRASRDRASDMFDLATEVRAWEIVVLHRAHRAADGACARVTWTRADPAQLDRMIEAYRDSLMPWWEQTEGFCSNSLMVDRQDGRCASTVVFDRRESMASTRDQFMTLREEFVARMGMDILDIGEFDVALAHLRVPETV
jgi:quinol monooxygenase YgiN